MSVMFAEFYLNNKIGIKQAIQVKIHYLFKDKVFVYRLHTSFLT